MSPRRGDRVRHSTRWRACVTRRAWVVKVGAQGKAQAMLAYSRQCGHYEYMSVQITIRDVPERVRHELAARAAAQGRSMQEYLRMALERLAARPTADAWLAQVRKRKRAGATQLSSAQILSQRDADRR